MILKEKNVFAQPAFHIAKFSLHKRASDRSQECRNTAMMFRVCKLKEPSSRKSSQDHWKDESHQKWNCRCANLHWGLYLESTISRGFYDRRPWNSALLATPSVKYENVKGYRRGFHINKFLSKRGGVGTIKKRCLQEFWRALSKLKWDH